MCEKKWYCNGIWLEELMLIKYLWQREFTLLDPLCYSQHMEIWTQRKYLEFYVSMKEKSSVKHHVWYNIHNNV